MSQLIWIISWGMSDITNIILGVLARTLSLHEVSESTISAAAAAAAAACSIVLLGSAEVS
jgi:hypothetical protein